VAQWSRGFPGNAHATRVEEAEVPLRAAVATFKAQGASAPPQALKTIRKLAEKLLSARPQLLKARPDQRLAAILTEFSVEEAVESSER
jgi:hypothetical protein